MTRQGLGKVDRDYLGRVILGNTGASNRSVLVGPGLGLDNAVVSTGRGRVMIVTADPLSIIPSIGMDDSAWLTVHELASDLATSAVAPELAVFDYNLPPSLSSGDFEAYVRSVSRECRRLGIAIIGGHTGRYPGSGFTVVGGGMMISLADEGAYVTPKMVHTGDALLMTKGSAIEATALLALSFPEKTEKAVGGKVARRARSYLRRCSTVEDSLAASSAGVRGEGVTAMHDATEGGVLGGLYELANASGRTITVRREALEVSEESRMVCEAFGLDPLITISEGTLLIACRPGRSREVLRRLGEKGIDGFVIGSVQEGPPRLRLTEGGRTKSYAPPRVDPYWQVYARGVEKGWK